MRSSVREIAGLVDGELVGDGETAITGVCGIEDAEEGDITFIANPRYLPFIKTTNASCIIVSRELYITGATKPIIKSANPSLAFVKVVDLFSPKKVKHPVGIDARAAIGKGVKLGKDAALGAYSVVEDDAAIGERSIIYPCSYIGRNTKIGADCVIYPNVTVREDVQVGDRVIIHSGTTIGADGFGFVEVDGAHHKIPQLGVVVIEDDVEIGANVAIDRARFGKTVIGRGTKIDNLVQIAHNVQIGENSIIVAQVGISGSTKIGRHVILAGQAGLVGHISVGDNAVVAAQSGVSKSIPANTVVWGYPAKPIDKAKKVNAALQRLPDLAKRVAELESELKELRGKIGQAADDKK